MPLTPAEVRNVIFSKPPVGERGYHEDEVDHFLDLVHAELARLIEENNDLRNQLEQLDQQQHAVPGDTGRRPGPPPAQRVMTPVQPSIREQSSPDAEHNLQTATMLVSAQERADQVMEEAHAQADRMLTQARTHCAHLLSEAQVTAEDMVHEARTRVETMLHSAHTTAQTRERQSREKAASLEQDATRKHAEILNALNQDKRLLEDTIDALRSFEQEYRTQLAIYLQLQLDKLDGSGSAAPVDPILIQQDSVGSGMRARGETGQSPLPPG
jgi:DivIVA domain-containing protein